jgi:hypothetical protein
MGNIGSKERLDFTVVGPALDEVARIAAVCRSVDQPIVISSEFAASVGAATLPSAASLLSAASLSVGSASHRSSLRWIRRGKEAIRRGSYSTPSKWPIKTDNARLNEGGPIRRSPAMLRTDSGGSLAQTRIPALRLICSPAL